MERMLSTKHKGVLLEILQNLPPSQRPQFIQTYACGVGAILFEDDITKILEEVNAIEQDKYGFTDALPSE